MLPRVRETVALASKMGVVMAAGSDMRYDASSTYFLVDEIGELVGAGVPPMEAIKAATSAAARCIGVAGRTGAIRTGLEADLIVVEQNPLTDVRVLRNAVMIINDGRIVINGVERPAK
jgi:imidazolonepropionase-like amidohydrolase